MKLVHRIFRELWQKSARGWQLAQAAGRMLSAVMSAPLRTVVLTATRVKIIRKVAIRLTGYPWGKWLLRRLEAQFHPSEAPPTKIFREVIASAEKVPGFVPGRIILVCGNLAPGGAQRQAVLVTMPYGAMGAQIAVPPAVWGSLSAIAIW